MMPLREDLIWLPVPESALNDPTMINAELGEWLRANTEYFDLRYGKVAAVWSSRADEDFGTLNVVYPIRLPVLGQEEHMSILAVGLTTEKEAALYRLFWL